jgi:hypothetical protein
MRASVLSMGAVVATACAVSTQQYYVPSDARYAEGGTVCGFVPWGQARVPLAESLSTSVQLRPVEGRVGMSLQLALPQGTKVRLSEPDVRLQVPSSSTEYTARLDRFRVSVLGRDGRPGHFEYVDAASVLEGKGRNADLAGPDTQYAKKDLFISSTLFAARPEKAYVLKLPAIEVNGVLQEPRSIPVELVEKTGIATCVQ